MVLSVELFYLIITVPISLRKRVRFKSVIRCSIHNNNEKRTEYFMVKEYQGTERENWMEG